MPVRQVDKVICSTHVRVSTSSEQYNGVADTLRMTYGRCINYTFNKNSIIDNKSSAF